MRPVYFAVLLVFLAACGGPSMGEQEAYAAADACRDAGQVLEDGTYAPTEQTWRFGIEAEAPGCDPVCIVSANGSAEVHWRCRGVEPPAS